MNRINSINVTLIMGIFFSLLIPISFTMWYISVESQEQLYDDFQKFRDTTTKNAAEALSDPVYYYSPNNGGLVLELLKHDPKVVKIIVYDTFNDIDFLEIILLNAEQGNLFKNSEKIYKNGEEIGYISITFSDSKLIEQVKEIKKFIVTVFCLVFLVLFSVLLPLIYFKVLYPLKRLTKQAMQLRERNLKEPFKWTGKDEINLVGQTFELARIDTLNHVNELREISETDRLTKLYNRHKTDKILLKEQERSIRFGYTFALLLIDVDNFKIINDTYGHQMGDSILKDISKILKDNSRNVDTVGRWGGEEFMIICPEADEIGLKVFANKIVNIINSSTFEIERSQSVSIGATLYRESENVSETISRSDKALYEAKTTGKNKAIII